MTTSKKSDAKDQLARGISVDDQGPPAEITAAAKITLIPFPKTLTEDDGEVTLTVTVVPVGTIPLTAKWRVEEGTVEDESSPIADLRNL